MNLKFWGGCLATKRFGFRSNSPCADEIKDFHVFNRLSSIETRTCCSCQVIYPPWFSSWKRLVCGYRLSQSLLFNFHFFSFLQISNGYCLKSYRKIILFIIDFESSYEVLLRQKYFWSTDFWQWNDGPFDIF